MRTVCKINIQINLILIIIDSNWELASVKRHWWTDDRYRRFHKENAKKICHNFIDAKQQIEEIPHL